MPIKIPAQRVKELRNQTGAGMMDCKNALEDSIGNMQVAIENLRKKGLASANKKIGRITTEGLIVSYIHSGSRIGVLVELNCETDFVARRVEFNTLAKDIAMQIAACPYVNYVSINEINENIIRNEKKIESSKEDVMNKPQAIKDKIVAGRIDKRLKEMSLMNQLFIKDQDLTIEDLINQHIALLGENIKIRRFEKFILGEGLTKRSSNFATEVEQIITKI
ncbi:translation elongation factor Ts (plastid) [Chondrus crispus]|uniref:Elongation factor Ts, mitochondrial n=1 Tax=Chondrus crispus TaxID=2769 RepID=M5DET0_CHOCR|nr:translation elongation factor Ts [Chondrus crispus]CCP38176.1 translation elongation factor Ts [Chondrus crispus]|eukprot:YP_007627429.1 translation elongation factor Ts (plastid) [Chondrus crispus]